MFPTVSRAQKIAGACAAAAWMAFTAWCVAGYPPSVDLPVHGAQMQTLVALLRGERGVSSVFQPEFRFGYGFGEWLLLPVAWALNGAAAARLGAWLGLQIFGVGAWAFLRAWGRPGWLVLAALPLAFNATYYYGFLSFNLGLGVALASLARFSRLLQELEAGKPTRRRLFEVAALSAFALLIHVLAFVAVAAGVVALALASRHRRSAFRAALAVLLPGAALSIPRILLTASALRGPSQNGLEYGGLKLHLWWFWQNTGPEGRLGTIVPLAVSAALLASWLLRRRAGPAGPAAVAFALLALYFAAPRSAGGIWGIFIRFPTLVAVAALAAVALEKERRAVLAGVVALCLLPLVEVARWHARFKTATAGLEHLATPAKHERQAYLSLDGDRILGSSHIYLRHLGTWFTAEHGGIANNIAAESTHCPVHMKEGVVIPQVLRTQEDASWYDTVIVFGKGPLPEALSGFCLASASGPWRLLARTDARPPRASGIVAADALTINQRRTCAAPLR